MKRLKLIRGLEYRRSRMSEESIIIARETYLGGTLGGGVVKVNEKAEFEHVVVRHGGDEESHA